MDESNSAAAQASGNTSENLSQRAGGAIEMLDETEGAGNAGVAAAQGDLVGGLPPGFGIPHEQEPKYGINTAGRLFKRSTGIEIPDSEPVFVLRAKDAKALAAMSYYQSICEHTDHKTVVGQRMHDFAIFRAAHPELMKEPTSDVQDLAGDSVSEQKHQPA
jgi:hypothetical protein